MITGLNSLELDFSEEKLFLFTGEKVYIATDDKVCELTLEFDQFQKLHDEFRDYIGEKTVEELEDTILALEQKIEDLEEKLEIQEQHEEALRDKYNEGYPF